jgi:uncharacterized protein YeeX (DUF496 family)
MKRKTKEQKRVILVDALADYFTVRQMQETVNAIDVALEDSYEWSKHSDPGDNRREQESKKLMHLMHLLINAKNKKGTT